MDNKQKKCSRKRQESLSAEKVAKMTMRTLEKLEEQQLRRVWKQVRRDASKGNAFSKFDEEILPRTLDTLVERGFKVYYNTEFPTFLVSWLDTVYSQMERRKMDCFCFD